MRTIVTLLATLFTSTAAAPAIVWSGESSAPVHSSELTELRSLIENNVQSSLSSVVFVVERDENKSEGLTSLTSSGSLPKIAGKYSEANAIHHSVRGIETVSKAAKELGVVTTMSLEDFATVTSETNKVVVNNDGKVSGETIVVSISNESEASDIDSIVTAAIENANIGSVVLTSVRGLSEVKFERELRSKQDKINAQERISRRRLEDGNNYYYNELTPFVYFTPNIFSGVMFFFFFAIITYIGIGCMGMISGQDLYVTKYPTIGREA